jgi:hypothetical protein
MYKMKIIIIAAIGIIFLCIGTADASQLMIVRCSAPTGINLGAYTERDKPKDSNPEVYDSAAGGYLSHLRKGHESIITVNQDGTATETSLLDSGNSIVTEMHVLGSINDNAISVTDGTNGLVNLVTLYPKDSIGIFSGAQVI